MIERSLVILKPKAVSGGHMGEIISRFERVGLKIIGGKLMHVDPDTARRHYPDTRREFLEGMGNKSIENYEKFGMSIQDDFGTSDPHEIGLTIRERLIQMITSDLVFVTVWEGPHAIEVIRKLVGHTLPLMAAPGTIRGDYGYDSSYLANIERRPIDNLIHASSNPEEAAYEIGLWFPEIN